jgi:hypothetical protein
MHNQVYAAVKNWRFRCPIISKIYLNQETGKSQAIHYWYSIEYTYLMNLTFIVEIILFSPSPALHTERDTDDT